MALFQINASIKEERGWSSDVSEAQPEVYTIDEWVSMYVHSVAANMDMEDFIRIKAQERYREVGSRMIQQSTNHSGLRDTWGRVSGCTNDSKAVPPSATCHGPFWDTESKERRHSCGNTGAELRTSMGCNAELNDIHQHRYKGKLAPARRHSSNSTNSWVQSVDINDHNDTASSLTEVTSLCSSVTNLHGPSSKAKVYQTFKKWLRSFCRLSRSSSNPRSSSQHMKLHTLPMQQASSSGDRFDSNTTTANDDIISTTRRRASMGEPSVPTTTCRPFRDLRKDLHIPKDHQNHDVFSTRITFRRLIRTSQHSQVWVAQYDGIGVAAKVSQTQDLSTEFNILKHLHASQRITTAVVMDDDTIRGQAMMMRLYEHEEVQRQIRFIQDTCKPRWDREFAFLHLAHQVALAVQDVHLMDIVHCNLQVSSLLWCNKKKHVVLGSFSRARGQGEDVPVWDPTPGCANMELEVPPEHRCASGQRRLHSSSDIWQLAMCMLEMWQEAPAKKRHEVWCAPQDIPLRPMWLRCLQENPESRPRIHEIVNAVLRSEF